MRNATVLALAAAVLLVGCNVQIVGGAAGGAGSEETRTGEEPGSGGAPIGTTLPGTGGEGPSVPPTSCNTGTAELPAWVPATLTSTGGTVEITTLPDPVSDWISTAVTTTFAIPPGEPSFSLPSDGHSPIAVMFFDPSGALVDGSILTPLTPSSPPPPTGQTIHVPAQIATIQAAINAAQPGDTVLVAPGIYTEHVVLESGVRLQGSGADLTTLDGQGSGFSLVDADDARGASVRGFRFVNVGPGAQCPDDVFECAGDYQPAAVHALSAEFSCDPSTKVLVADNVFEDNHLAVMIGWQGFALARNNLFRFNEHALVVNHGADNHVLVRENVFYDNAHALEGDATYLHVDHNVIAANGVALRRAHVQTAPPRCNAFFGNAVEQVDDFSGVLPGVIGVDGNTSFDGPADVGPAITAGCFAPGTDPATIGFGTFAGSFGEAFAAQLGNGG